MVRPLTLSLGRFARIVILLMAAGCPPLAMLPPAVLAGGETPTAFCQEADPPRSDDALKEKVEELLKQLSAARIPERDAAEQELVALGPEALDFLEIPSSASTDSRERVQRVRTQLEKLAIEAATEASRLRLEGTLTLNQALEAISRQTGNEVALPEGFGETVGATEISLALQDVTFWTAIDTICEQAGLVVDPYGSQPGTLILTPRPPSGGPPTGEAIPLSQDSVFQVAVTRVDASRNLAEPALSYNRMQLRIRWEPRIQPVSIEIPLDQVKIVDEFDRPVPLPEGSGVLSGILQSGIPEMDVLLTLPRIDRQVENLQSLTAELKAVLPGRVETFRFRDVSQLEPGTELRKSGAVLTYLGTTKNEDLYAVQLKLGFDETNGAFESYQGWVFDNPAFLLDDEGNRRDPVGMETLSQNDREVAIQYFFLENPFEHTIAYQTPSSIIAVPVKIQFGKIPLP